MSTPPPGKGRNRRGHPTTSEPHYTESEEELLHAVARWRERNRRPPTVAEILAIVIGLGYSKAGSPRG